MVIRNLILLEEKIQRIVGVQGERILLIAPITDKTTIYEPASFLAFPTLSTVVAQSTDWEIKTWAPRSTDLEREKSNLAEVIRQFSPSVLGIISTSPEHADAIRTIKYGLTLGDFVIVKGGIHEKDCYETTLKNNPEIDFSFVGEADLSLPEFLRRIRRKETIKSIAGVSYRTDGGVISVKKKFLSEQELSQMPFPEVRFLQRGLRWDLFEGKEVARVMSQRGCNYRCDFCASSYCMRREKVDKVIDYIAQLSAAGFEAVFFEDATFTLDRHRTIALLDGLIQLRESGMALEYGTSTRYDRLDDELIAKLAQAGFTYIYAGSESYSDAVLKKIHKRLTVGEIIDRTKKLKEAGIRVGAPIARGFTGDNEQIFAYNLGVILKLQPEYLFIEGAKIYPGTVWSREYGEKEVHELYDRGIETPSGLSAEDSKTLLRVDPSELEKAYLLAAKVLNEKYDIVKTGFYKLRK